MTPQVWIDGRLVDKTAARISVYDHTILFGDGVWCGTRIYHHRPFLGSAYLDAMRATAEDWRLPVPYTREELHAAINQTLIANDRSEGYLRITITRGAGTLGLDPRKCDPCVIILADDVMPYPRDLLAAGLDLITATVRRPPGSPFRLARPDDIQAQNEALAAGCLEALLLDPEGHVVGTTDGLVLIARSGQLTLASPARDPVLAAWLAGWVPTLGIPLVQASVELATVRSAEEVLLVSTAAEIVPITRLDGQPIGPGVPGPLALRLRSQYREAASRLY